MTLETATKIIDRIEACSDTVLVEDLWKLAIRYAQMRADWAVSDEETRRSLDDSRRRSHNALIDQINILSRFMAGKGEDNSWRTELGDDRKEIGDFACWVHAVLGIRAR